ncbi:nucleotidyltransferase domain-containing protein [Chromatiaceae bacterium AAb-1]|nr:nucleotidyltransferase domain-containing protein [Chromatiaceae bacterium AAb-1]
MKRPQITAHLQEKLPALLAVYAFGSQISGTADSDSDLDLAVLVEGYTDTVLLWQLASELAEISGIEIDLLDFRAASTIMQYQIITTGECWWAKDSQAAIYEAAILSEKTALDSAREPLLKMIKESGKVYG